MGIMLDQTKMLINPHLIMNPITVLSYVFYAVYAFYCLLPMTLQIYATAKSDFNKNKAFSAQLNQRDKNDNQ
jgi:hypothetical protein